MLIIPAIDLKDGCVVRLLRGAFDKKTVYSKDPVRSAKHWVKQGARLIHIVDLDGAASGVAKNIEIVKEICRSVDAGIQFGGGVRDIGTIQVLIDSGIQRVVLGTKAIEDGQFLKKAYTKFKDRIIVSLDVQDGLLRTKGWVDQAEGIELAPFIESLKEVGFREVIFTDISKDGTLKGPSIKVIKDLLKKTGIGMIASGGVSSLEDIKKLKELEKYGITGVIVGKALYEARFTLSEAITYGGLE